MQVLYEEKVQGRWGRVATRCAANAEHVEDSRREDDIIMHKDYDLSPDMREEKDKDTWEGGAKAAA